MLGLTIPYTREEHPQTSSPAAEKPTVPVEPPPLTAGFSSLNSLLSLVKETKIQILEEVKDKVVQMVASTTAQMYDKLSALFPDKSNTVTPTGFMGDYIVYEHTETKENAEQRKESIAGGAGVWGERVDIEPMEEKDINKQAIINALVKVSERNEKELMRIYKKARPTYGLPDKFSERNHPNNIDIWLSALSKYTGTRGYGVKDWGVVLDPKEGKKARRPVESRENFCTIKNAVDDKTETTPFVIQKTKISELDEARKLDQLADNGTIAKIILVEENGKIVSIETWFNHFNCNQKQGEELQESILNTIDYQKQTPPEDKLHESLLNVVNFNRRSVPQNEIQENILRIINFNKLETPVKDLQKNILNVLGITEEVTVKKNLLKHIRDLIHYKKLSEESTVIRQNLVEDKWIIDAYKHIKLSKEESAYFKEVLSILKPPLNLSTFLLLAGLLNQPDLESGYLCIQPERNPNENTAVGGDLQMTAVPKPSDFTATHLVGIINNILTEIEKEEPVSNNVLEKIASSRKILEEFNKVLSEVSKVNQYVVDDIKAAKKGYSALSILQTYLPESFKQFMRSNFPKSTQIVTKGGIQISSIGKRISYDMNKGRKKQRKGKLNDSTFITALTLSVNTGISAWINEQNELNLNIRKRHIVNKGDKTQVERDTQKVHRNDVNMFMISALTLALFLKLSREYRHKERIDILRQARELMEKYIDDKGEIEMQDSN